MKNKTEENNIKNGEKCLKNAYFAPPAAKLFVGQKRGGGS